MSGIAWLESLLQQQGGADVTAGHVTAGDAALTPQNVTATDPELTAAPVTAPRRYKARARRCEVCRETFTPKSNKSAKCCSDRCRQQKRRAKLAQQRKAEAAPKEAQQALCACLWCGLDFLADPTKHPKYHRSCKEYAYRQRRLSAIETVAILRGYSTARAADLVEREGMKKISRYLRQQGYSYDEAGRAWLILVSEAMAVPVGSVFVGVKG